MIILIKNNTAQNQTLSDLMGITIPANGQLDLFGNASLTEIAQSNDLVGLLANHTLTVNNGLQDLDPSDGIRYVSLTSQINPVAADGREIIKASSIPFLHQTYFTMVGDSTGIGDGIPFHWDASIGDDWITHDETPSLIVTPIPSGFKRKVLRARFNDPVYIKEGAIIFQDVSRGTYVDFTVVCPTGQYYYDRNKVLHLATKPTPISHYISKHYIFGTCQCSLSVISETCQDIATPTNYETWIEITAPESDVLSFGYIRFTLYRKRTALFEGEVI